MERREDEKEREKKNNRSDNGMLVYAVISEEPFTIVKKHYYKASQLTRPYRACWGAPGNTFRQRRTGPWPVLRGKVRPDA